MRRETKRNFGALCAAAALLSLLLPLAATAQEVVVERLDLGGTAISPTVRDSTLYFASNRKWSLAKTYGDQRGERLYGLFRVGVRERKPHGRPRPYMGRGARPFNMVSVAFAPDGAAYVSQNDPETAGVRGAPLAIRRYDDGRGAATAPLAPMPAGASCAMPTISPDGRLMIFASDKLGGEGRVDLYCCEKTAAGWGEPRNMGPEVNTPGVETSPYIHSSGKIFFSSNGRDDSRGLDIYYTYRNDDGTFATPQKFDDELCSLRDDFGLWYSDDEKWGYFCSNRDGGDAIYYFQRTFPTFAESDSLQTVELCYTLFEASAENYDTASFVCRWTFGDGASATGIEASHCYAGVGSYTIELSVVDKTTDEEMFSLAQYELEIALPEQVGIEMPERVVAGEPVTLVANTDGLPGFRPREFYWDMGNGDKVKGRTATTVFAAPGRYRVSCGTIDARSDSERRCTWTWVTVE